MHCINQNLLTFLYDQITPDPPPCSWMVATPVMLLMMGRRTEADS